MERKPGRIFPAAEQPTGYSAHLNPSRLTPGGESGGGYPGQSAKNSTAARSATFASSASGWAKPVTRNNVPLVGAQSAFQSVALAYSADTMAPLPPSVLAELDGRTCYAELVGRLNALRDYCKSIVDGYKKQFLNWENVIQTYAHTFDALASRELFELQRVISALESHAAKLEECLDNADTYRRAEINNLIGAHLVIPHDPLRSLVSADHIPSLPPREWYDHVASLIEGTQKKVQKLRAGR